LVPDVSAPVLLQADDASFANLENRVPDLFNAGYAQLLTPPPGRADSGNQSVGYDVYNRFDLGGPGNPTLYGTETGLKALVAAVHRMGGNYYSDLVWNHDGFSQWNTTDGQGNSFLGAGGYPGFAMQTPSDRFGDFHDPSDTSLTGGQLAGLIDIAQEKDYQYVRSPVDPNDPRNLPAGTTPAFGRLANVPGPNNARFYPDQSLQPIIVFDPRTGEQNIHIYPFNNSNPLNGTPVAENALGYLMRYAQWMVQYVGVDGFRLDAAKNMPPWVLNYLDRAVYRSSFRTLLNGSQEQVFSFGEVFDGNSGFIQQFIRKDINPNDPGTVGGNRDALDFPLYFAMDANLTSNGLQNNWNDVVNASLDRQDDGLANNGSQGVAFVSSADSPPPYLDSVAYAYALMRPGNAIVYFNAKEFGPNRSFPRDGRGDALGGLYGNTITNLVNIRDTHPDGNYLQRDLEKETLIYERQDSLLVGLSNRLDSGYDSRTVQTSFDPGTPLIELTGNATDPTLDPDHVISPLLVVNSNGTVNMRVPRNRNDNGMETDKGYVIYAPSGPQGNLTLSNVDHVIPGQTPTAATNGTARLSSIPVIRAGSFALELDTNQVNLLGSVRDHDADGDNALFKIDDGVDVTGQGFVSTTPGSVTYGFQQFTGTHSPGYFNADGNGHYVQTIDVSRLGPGLHYLTVRAFRHRNAGEPPVYTDFRQAIYVDSAAPVSTVVSFAPIVAGVEENRRLVVRSTDLLANNVHVFFDLPAGLSDAQVRAMVGSGSQATRTDRDLWTRDATGLTSGNHVATVVSSDLAGSYAVQRFPGLAISSAHDAGPGDLNADGVIDATDVNLFGQVLASNNQQFNPAADLNGDGLVNTSDLLLLYPLLQQAGADDATFAAYGQLLGPPAAGYTIPAGQSLTLAVNQPSGTGPALTFAWDLTGSGTYSDAFGAGAVVSWSQLQADGISGPGTYTVAVLISDGTNAIVLTTTLTVLPSGPAAPLALRGAGDGPTPGGTADPSVLARALAARNGSSALTLPALAGSGHGVLFSDGRDALSFLAKMILEHRPAALPDGGGDDRVPSEHADEFFRLFGAAPADSADPAGLRS
jgi:glycosidase